ncbi:MAG: DUF134 domain-containing protein [Acidobacteria bacterium]|nr:DUF134 domain-containing protein [Acidobacteriota bacterium]
MGRPPVPRRIGCRFGARGFRPLGKPARDLPAVVLGLDELEALRLADVEGLYQEDAAVCMGVSRATFGRILASARSKAARAIVEGTVLLVGEDGGPGGSRSGTACPRHGAAGGRGRRCTCGGGGVWASHEK